MLRPTMAESPTAGHGAIRITREPFEPILRFQEEIPAVIVEDPTETRDVVLLALPQADPAVHPDPDPTRDRVQGAARAARSGLQAAVLAHQERPGPEDREDQPVVTDNPKKFYEIKLTISHAFGL